MLLAPSRIPLNVPSYGEEEIAEVLDSLKSGYLTMGKKVRRFEELWAEYIGVPYAVMTNSGSSANLVALTALTLMNGGLRPGDEVITPALTWATTVFPIAQAGLVPVLVDVDKWTYNISPEAVEAAITPRTKAIMPVHLLGNPCDMDALGAIADAHSLELIEDCCEAHGAESQGSRVGSNGLLATFSFFFSHHISTIEGGMVLTGNGELAELCRSLRAFGWVREMKNKEAIATAHPGIDPRFLFAYPGYNFRPMEYQGAFGIHQVGRLEGYIARRRQNAFYWNRELAQYGEWLALQGERTGTRHVWFAYPVRVRVEAPFARAELQNHLESRGIETRPIEAGNMAIQPAMQYIKHRVGGPLTNAQDIHDHAFFIGNHHGIGEAEREYIAASFHEFMRRYQ